MTELVINCLSTYYSIEATDIKLLPVGADMNAAVYKIYGRDQKIYFAKLKRGNISSLNIAIMELLYQAGIHELIMPIKTVQNERSQQVSDFTLMVYPFVEGQDGFSRPLTDEQWIALGRALRQVHEVSVPASLARQMRSEDFSPKWRDRVRNIYTHHEPAPVGDEIASNLWAFLQKNKLIIQRLVDRSEELSKKVRTAAHKFVLCHADLHGGNVLMTDNKAFYIVDWDDPMLAPKERDLMFIGGGVGKVWNNPHEVNLFYQGYGQSDVDCSLLSYYRHERIVEDIAEYCHELLTPSQKSDRLEMYGHFMDQFAPKGVVDIAFETDKAKQ